MRVTTHVLISAPPPLVKEPFSWAIQSLHRYLLEGMLQSPTPVHMIFMEKDKIIRTLDLTCFHASFFPFCLLCRPPLFLPLSGHLFRLFSRSKSALFCRAKGTIQSLERGSFRMDLSRNFGKEIPSRNLREKRSEMGQKNADISGP